MKKTRFNTLLSLFAGMLLILVAAFMWMMPQTNKAAADVAHFQMEKGAWARVAEDSGIRFRVEFDQSIKNRIDAEDAEFGFIVASNWSFNNYAGTDYINMTGSVKKAADKNKIYTENGYYMANGVLANLDETLYEAQFTAVAYLKEGSNYTYADFDKTLGRSVNYVLEQAVLSFPNVLNTVQQYYPHIGTTESPIRINNANDYAKIADAEKDFTDVNFKVASNFTLEEGYAYMPENFTGSFVDSENVISVKSADGSPKSLTENGVAIDNLGFKVVADAVMKINENTPDRIVNINTGKLNNETVPTFTDITVIEKGSENYPTFTSNGVNDYDGDILSMKLNTGGTSDFSLSFNGTAPEGAKYVEFWFAITNTGDRHFQIEAEELFYSYSTTNVGSTILNDQKANSLNINTYAPTAYGFATNTAVVNTWFAYYVPISAFNSYMDVDGTQRNTIDFSTYCGSNTAGATFYLGEITFTDPIQEAINAAEDPFGTANTDLSYFAEKELKEYTTEYRTYAVTDELKTIEFVNPKTVAGIAPTYKGLNYLTNEQLVAENVIDLGTYTGGAFKVADGQTGYLSETSTTKFHDGWYANMWLDVSNYTVEELNALKTEKGYTHLQVNYAFTDAWNIFCCDNSLTTANSTIKDCLLAEHYGLSFDGTQSVATNAMSTYKAKWQTVNVDIDKFIELATAAKSQTDTKENKVLIVNLKGNSSCVIDAYFGEMKFITIAA